MPWVHIPSELRERVNAFMPVARAVLNEDVDFETCVELLLELGLRSGLNSVIQHQDESTLVQAFHQLADVAPETVYGHVADRIALGADMRAQAESRRQIGSRPSS